MALARRRSSGNWSKSSPSIGTRIGEQVNETQLRQDFLDPFFVALGWDVFNEQGFAEAYRDVVLEQGLKVEQSVRAPDYCFRIGGTAKFFVEAKKPAVALLKGKSV